MDKRTGLDKAQIGDESEPNEESGRKKAGVRQKEESNQKSVGASRA